MGKVIRFELKKLVSRIGIYILVLMLAGLLVAGVFMYDPIERKDTTLSLVGETVSDMYTSFNNDFKADYVNMVAGVAEDAETYISTSSNYMKYNSKQEIDALFNKFDEYCLLYNEASATPSEYSVLLVGINDSLNNLKTALNEALQFSKDKTGYYILTTSPNYNKLSIVLNEISVNFDSPISHKLAGETYYNEYRNTLYNCLNNLVYPDLDAVATKYAPNGTYHSLIALRMSEIETKMQNEYNKALADSIVNIDTNVKKELNTLFNRYASCAETFAKAYASLMCVEALNSVASKTDRSRLVGYGDVSVYAQEELATEYVYYIEHNVSENDFANSLSVTHTSNLKANAYDFTFFVMSLFAIAVIIFATYLSANTIAGEINNNTMRFVAVRPVKRGTLYMGKYIAILIMSLILLLFGTITSFVVGGILFGFNSANILMIINGSSVLVAHPIAVLGLFVLSQLLIIAVYSAFTMLLSSIMKSDLLAMAISVVIYLVNFILPLFFGAGSWLRFYPLANINLFAYFGGNRLASDSVLSKLFNNIVYHGMNIWISLIYVVGISLILLLLGKLIFRKREL